MKRLWVLVLCCAPAVAAITGTVVNRTTGKPEAGVAIGHFKVGNGLELIEEARSNAQGGFTFSQTPPGPSVLRATVDGVNYTQMLTPGAPATGIEFNVYNASGEPGAAKVTKHMILFQPSDGQVAIKETYLFSNDGNVAWNDSRDGTLRFYLPAAAGGKAAVNATAPGSMSISALLVKTSQAGVYGVDFAIKPGGETRIDLDYAVPYADGAPYQGKIVTKDENTYLISPNGVTLTGDHLNDLGVEPQSQAHIYGLAGSAYKIALSGTAVAAQDNSAGDAGEADNGPQVETVMPHVSGQAPLILALALAVLALGFAILYRRSPGPTESARLAGKETNARGRR